MIIKYLSGRMVEKHQLINGKDILESDKIQYNIMKNLEFVYRDVFENLYIILTKFDENNVDNVLQNIKILRTQVTDKNLLKTQLNHMDGGTRKWDKKKLRKTNKTIKCKKKHLRKTKKIRKHIKHKNKLNTNKFRKRRTIKA